MTLSQDIVIGSEPEHVYRALLTPEALGQWWGCTAVLDAREGGHWAVGWGAGEGGLGHGTVLAATITELRPNEVVAITSGGIEVRFHMHSDAAGTRVNVSQVGFDQGPDGFAAEHAALQSWLGAVMALKGWVESTHPYAGAVADDAPQYQEVDPNAGAYEAPAHYQEQPYAPAEEPAYEAPAPAPVARGGGFGSDPYASTAGGEARVLETGGFAVSTPHAVVKSWSKEQGFGYVTHPELGDVVFDYDGCDFEPAPGDRVLLLALAKRFDGRPKVKRIVCPDKGSNIQ